MAKSKCAQNSYYDGLVEKCMPCYLRCSRPPVSCTAFCTKPLDSPSSEPENHNVWLIVVFTLLCAVSTLMLILQVLRKRSCQLFPRKKGRNREQVEDSERGSERNLETSNKTNVAHDRTMISEESEQMYENGGTHYNSSLPLPSTEEGITILVTTKTAQTNDYAHYCMQDKTLDLWRSVSVT
ncbi:hypothetical protein AAFF_G00081300 [Aldrovandia affinis]|uniref:BCMA TALL-1 binding domain-containing protein n=1 Tax=Aldrovandia affinis TaxID=143900 RepID=A0AAD7WYG9_9TELE|nr:hypothetical protein AAFF_G00081300 [Aldrovandia affinis]